tara:strand:+ start:769 stop:1470 length:702 start_codon:yes stop_codon:yes gene_type:complete
MNCIIIEDDIIASSLLKKLCEKVPQIEQITVISSAIEGIKALEQNNFDLLFLDIEMPDLSGMDILRTFKNLPPVILTTSNREFALESYEHGVLDYLVKPIDLARLIKAIGKLSKQQSSTATKSQTEKSKKETFFIRSEGKHIQISQADILYLETMDDYITFYLEGNKKHIVHGTMKKMEEKLNNKSLLRVHRSYMVNLNKVSSIEDTHLEINGKVIPVSRANRPILMEKIKML